ncbi:MAG: hypothetical protein NTW29_18580 [Bacteroidetes bacterium]|nr:hypothetical protein [Bacteroidota bacterium]
MLEKLFEHINTYLYLLLPFLFLIVKSRKRDNWILTTYGIVFFLLLFFYYDIPKSIISIAYQPFYTTVEYLFFASLFYLNLETKRYKKAILIFSSLFIIFQFCYILFIEKKRLDSIPIGIESILIFLFIIFFFIESINSTKGMFIYTNHCFWIAVGLLFYLGGSFFLNILGSTLSSEEFQKYWFFNYIADSIKTLFFALAFILVAYQKENESERKLENIPFLDME